MRNALKVLVVVAFAIPTMASALISNTKHNLTSTGPGTLRFTDPSADMCKFCHLVHDANTTLGTLWARPNPTGVGFTTPTTTSDGTALDPTNAALGAGSQKCLSCHDGTVAMNTVINAALVYSQVATNAISGGTVSIIGGNVFLRGSTYLSTLNGQHPVGIPFAGQTGSQAVANEYGTAQIGGCAPGVPFCVTGSTTPAAGQFIKLFGTVAGTFQVECGSCHEPHTENVGGHYPFFLRVSGATVNGRCGACHKK